MCLYSLQVKRRQRVLQGRAPRRFHRCELLPGLVRRGLDVEGFGVFDTEYANQTLTESVEDRDGFEDIFARGRGVLVRKYANDLRSRGSHPERMGGRPRLREPEPEPGILGRHHGDRFVAVAGLRRGDGYATHRPRPRPASPSMSTTAQLRRSAGPVEVSRPRTRRRRGQSPGAVHRNPRRPQSN